MEFCLKSARIWQIVGYIIVIVKIVIPLVIIILGIIDLGKAVVSSDDKAISKSVKSLAMRIVAAVCIFFVPTVVSFVIGVVDTSVNDDSAICRSCISNPGGDTCSGAYSALNE